MYGFVEVVTLTLVVALVVKFLVLIVKNQGAFPVRAIEMLAVLPGQTVVLPLIADVTAILGFNVTDALFEHPLGVPEIAV